MISPDEISDPGLADYAGVLRRRKATILLCTVLVVGAAIGASWLQKAVYAARAKVLLQPRSTDALFNPSTGQRNDPARAVDTEIQVVKSEPVRAAVRAKLGVTPGISASSVGQTDVIQLVAESRRPAEAARVANAYANAYIDFRRKQAVDDLLAASQEIQAKVGGLQQQIDDLDGQVDRALPNAQAALRQDLAPQKEALVKQQAAFKERLDQVQVDAALTTGRAQLVASAATPRAPVRPKPVRSGVLGLIAGLALGIVLAFVAERLDDSAKTKHDVEQATGGLPVVGIIPTEPGWKRKGDARVVSLTEPRSAAAEAYRTVRTSIQFLGVERPIRSLQVTSPNAEEAKTTTVANLGVVLSSAGQRVLIVCCDLRRPRVHEFFGLDNSVGLTSVLVGRTPVSGAVQAVPGQRRLSLLASGPLPPNPAELLASARTGDVLAALESQFDVLLVDSPPVLPVTDALVVSRRVDATLLACFGRATTRKDIRRAVELLAQVDAPLVGAILSGASVESTYGYAYSYAAAASPLDEADASDGSDGHKNERDDARRAAELAL